MEVRGVASCRPGKRKLVCCPSDSSAGPEEGGLGPACTWASVGPGAPVTEHRGGTAGQTHGPCAVPPPGVPVPGPPCPLLCACPQWTRPFPEEGAHTPCPPTKREHGHLCALAAGPYLEVRGALEGLPAHGADVDALAPVGRLAMLQQQAGRGEAAAALQARVQPGLLLGRAARGQAGGDVRYLQQGRIPTEPLRPGSQTTPGGHCRLPPTALTNLGRGLLEKRDETSDRIVPTMQGRYTPWESDWPVPPV